MVNNGFINFPFSASDSNFWLFTTKLDDWGGFCIGIIRLGVSSFEAWSLKVSGQLTITAWGKLRKF